MYTVYTFVVNMFVMNVLAIIQTTYSSYPIYPNLLTNNLSNTNNL